MGNHTHPDFAWFQKTGHCCQGYPAAGLVVPGVSSRGRYKLVAGDLQMVRGGVFSAATVLAAAALVSIPARAQSDSTQHGVAANREYAAVFAHSDNPCSADYATAPYLQCMSRELEFVESHLGAFVDDLRGVAGSSEELAALNKADAAWHDYRESFCLLPYQRFAGGTIKGPMSADCRLRLDRAYMKELSGMYMLSQVPK
jgi:uncharacterized protein YecT (DUF1311 family)